MPRRSAQERRLRRQSSMLSVAAICAIALPATVVLSAPASAEDKFAGGKSVSSDAIRGDSIAQSATGSAQLVDGAGFEWFLNTDITFSTTSSASGAASEASSTRPIVASTVGGGTTTATLNDAFDGYNSLSTFVGDNAPPFNGGDATITRYNRNGAGPATSCGGRALDYPAQVNGDLTVSRQVFVPEDAGYARWTNTVTNTSSNPTTATLYISNNLGSDSNTRIFDTSGGDTTVDTSDSWIGTFQNWSGSTSSDPRIGHVLQGDDAQPSLITSSFANGDDNPVWAYQLTVPAGQTRSILDYTVLRGTQAEVSSAAAAIAADPPVACMTPEQADAVVNFGGLGTPPTLTLPTPSTQAAPGATSAAVDYSATATDVRGTSVPVTCTPPSGSVFPVGATTVTCTATDSQGRTTTGSFTVTVTAAPVTTPPAPATCDGEAVTIVAKPGVPTKGTAGRDVILGTEGADAISSGGGDDLICGLGGDDTIRSGKGDDMVVAGAGDDKVTSGRGDDTVLGGSGDDTVKAGRGEDLVKVGSGDDTVRASGDDDEIVAGAGDDKVRGGRGDDVIKGGPGDDQLVGGPGKDTIKGGSGRNTIDGVKG